MILSKRLRFTLWLASISSLISCTSVEDVNKTGPDASGLAQDASVLPDANLLCPIPTSVLPLSWRPINTISEGIVAPLSAGVVYIDGSAGGIQSSPDNPYLYIRFTESGPEKVEVSDTEATQNATWDLAVKRMVWKSNGGDSGLGGRRVSWASAATIAEVESIPPSAHFLEDDWVSDSCDFQSGLIEEPNTAVGVWYDYDMGQLSPMNTVYIVERPDLSRFLFKIATYYYNDIGSAHYEFHWAVL